MKKVQILQADMTIILHCCKMHPIYVYLPILTISYLLFEMQVLYVNRFLPAVLLPLFFGATDIARSRYFDF